jgi:tryptophan-rich sensory protein
MNWTAFWNTFALCLISIVIEALSTNKSSKQWFEKLQQPKYAFSFSFWYVVGGLYYLIIATLLYRLFDLSASWLSAEIIILCKILLANSLMNFVLFKYRSLKIFYYLLFPFGVLFFLLVFLLKDTDTFSTALACVYLLWLCYDLYYFRNLWKLNAVKNTTNERS